MNKDRINVLASKGAMMVIQTRLQSAEKAHGLLKRKVDALQLKFHSTLYNLADSRGGMNDLIIEAAMTVAKARYVIGNFSTLILENLSIPMVKISTTKENVAGVQLPAFQIIISGQDHFELTGLGKGGEQIKEIKVQYQKLLKYLTQYATLHISFTSLQGVIYVTNQRVSALEHLVIPRYNRTMAYIISELDEYDREEFYRLKKVKDKKVQAQQAKEQIEVEILYRKKGTTDSSEEEDIDIE